MAKAYAELVGQPPSKPAGQTWKDWLNKMASAKKEARKNPLNLYWDMTHGNDANDGSSQDSPIRTSERLTQLYETHAGGGRWIFILPTGGSRS